MARSAIGVARDRHRPALGLDGPVPAPAARRERVLGPPRPDGRLGVLAAPVVRVGAQHRELAQRLAARPAGDRAIHAADHGAEVVALQRLLGRAQVEADRVRPSPPRSKCPASDIASVSPASSSHAPASRCPSARSSAVSMPYAASRCSACRKPYSRSSRSFASARPAIHSAFSRRTSRSSSSAGIRAARAARGPRGAEHLAEHRPRCAASAGPRDRSPRGATPPSPAPSRAGPRGGPRRSPAPAPRGRTRCPRPSADRAHILRRRPVEHAAHEPLARPSRQLAEPHLDRRPRRPEPREEIMRLGARERDHQQGPPLAEAQRRVHELHARRVAPVQVLQDQRERPRAALRLDEVDPGAAHLIAHPHRILPRRAELHPPLVRERRARDLAEEHGHAIAIGRGHAARHPVLQLLPLRLERLAAPELRLAPHDLGDEAEGRARPHRIAARAPHLRGHVAARRCAGTSSWRSRDLPTPAGPVTTAARAPGSPTHSSKIPSSVAISRSRPTNGVGLPSSVRTAPSATRSRTSSKRPFAATSRSAGRAGSAVTSSRSTGSGSPPKASPPPAPGSSAPPARSPRRSTCATRRPRARWPPGCGGKPVRERLPQRDRAAAARAAWSVASPLAHERDRDRPVPERARSCPPRRAIVCSIVAAESGPLDGRCPRSGRPPRSARHRLGSDSSVPASAADRRPRGRRGVDVGRRGCAARPA